MKATILYKTSRGDYKSETKNFNNEAHLYNYINLMDRKGNKVIGKDMNTYTTQRTAVAKIQEYLAKLNLVMLGMEYKKGRIIDVTTSEGIMSFEYGEEFKLKN